LVMTATGPVVASDNAIRQFNSTGGLVWTAAFTGHVNSLAVDGSGNLLAVGGMSLRKYDGAGNIVWTRSATFTLNGVTAAADDTIQVAGNATSNASVQTWTSDGTAGAIANGPAGSTANAVRMRPAGVLD